MGVTRCMLNVACAQWTGRRETELKIDVKDEVARALSALVGLRTKDTFQYGERHRLTNCSLVGA